MSKQSEFEKWKEIYLDGVTRFGGNRKDLGIFEGPIVQGLNSTAAHILKVAEEWCNRDIVKHPEIAPFKASTEASAANLLWHLKQYIQGEK